MFTLRDLLLLVEISFGLPLTDIELILCKENECLSYPLVDLGAGGRHAVSHLHKWWARYHSGIFIFYNGKGEIILGKQGWRALPLYRDRGVGADISQAAPSITNHKNPRQKRSTLYLVFGPNPSPVLSDPNDHIGTGVISREKGEQK